MMMSSSVVGATNDGFSWINWTARALWLSFVFGWPIAVLAGCALCCWCCCGVRRSKASDFLVNALVLYPVLLACLWYWTPGAVFDYVVWIWHGTLVVIDWTCIWVEWALDRCFVVAEVFIWIAECIWQLGLLFIGWITGNQ